MKYMVLVNRKYMVAVETEGSALAAEHIILDNYEGIQGAQAFDKNAMKTSYFFEILQDVETISLNELKQKSDKYTEAFRELARKQDAVQDIKEEIERVKGILEDLEHDKEKLEAERNRAYNMTIVAKDALNYKEA